MEIREVVGDIVIEFNGSNFNQWVVSVFPHFGAIKC